MKKVLLLGGAMHQIAAILKAKELGYYTITCDYLPDNPGHRYSDEYHNVSTTDKEGVLKLARKLRIGGIVAYGSDPAAPTAAYVAENMGLPTSPYRSVEILTRKDLFRSFLAEHGFKVPSFGSYTCYEDALSDIGRLKFPAMVKPVDSSGSKGVVKVSDICELKAAVEEALSYSRQGRFIVEEFIVKKGYQISGDGFSVDGKLVFTSFGNELYSGKGTRDYVALGEFWPCLLSDELQRKVHDELQRLVTALEMRSSAYNIEVILDERDDVYILEMGPRNGGSYIPQLIQYATGVDTVEYTIKAAVGEDCRGLEMKPTRGYWSNYVILSTQSGRFKGIWFDSVFKRDNLVDCYCTHRPGDQVTAYRNTTHSLGTIIFKASSLDEMLSITQNIERCVRVEVE